MTADQAVSDKVVTVAAAPLWATIEAALELGDVESTSYEDYRAWAAGLLEAESALVGALDSVALSGEPVRVIEPSSDGFVQVELLAQPNGDAGYRGFMNADYFGPDPRQTATHIVRAGGTIGTSTGDMRTQVQLPAGATVEVLTSRQDNTQVDVRLASGALVRCPMSSLRPSGYPLPSADVLDIATAFLGSPYLWGGTESSGIDCSGLIHVAARIGGHVLPRDVHYQWEATRIDAGVDELVVGDLLFFGDEASMVGIDHVGIYAGAGRLVHAPRTGRNVALEPISSEGRARMVGYGRIPGGR